MSELERWCATFEGHLVLTAAARYAFGRSTGGSLATLAELARLVPHAGVNTALVIARDMRQACGVWEGDGGRMKASCLKAEERDLYVACVERMAEVCLPEGEEWRLA